MGDLSPAAAGRLVLRGFPFLLLRIAVYLGIAAAFAVAAGSGAGIGLAFGALAGPAGRAPGAFWGAAAGFAFVVLLLRWLREYLLYLVEMSHAAAIAAALDGAAPPPGRGRIAAAMEAVQRCFRDAERLQAAERLARGTLASLAGTVDTHAPLLPPKLAGALLRRSLGFVARAALARTVRRTARNPYADLRDSLLLLAQNHEPLLRRAALLAAAGAGAGVLLFLLSLPPAAAVARAAPGAAAPLAMALALAFAWCLHRALVEPFLAAAFLDAYSRATRGQEPDADWDARLAEISEPYRALKALAAPARRGARRDIVV